MIKHFIISFFVFFVTFFADAGFYKVIHISYPNTSRSMAYGLNNHGDVVGIAGWPGHWLPFFCTKDGVFQNIGDYPISSGASDINDLRDIVITIKSERTILRTSSGDLIPVSDDIPASIAICINNRQQVLLSGMFSGEPKMKGFIWDPSNNERTLLDSSGAYFSQPFSLNDAMWAVGDAWLIDEKKEAFLYTPEHGFQILPSLQDGRSLANGINNHGIIVGAVEEPEGIFGDYYPVYWDKNQKLHLLSDNDDIIGSATSINNVGQIVGNAARGFQTAFLFERGELKYLDDLISPASEWSIPNAEDINDRGFIIANGYHPNFQGIQALLLIPPTELSWGNRIPGRPAKKIRVTGAEPGDKVLFFIGYNGLGTGPCFPEIGFCLNILDPQFMGFGRVNKFGVASPMLIPPLARRVKAYCQAVIIHNTDCIVLEPVDNDKIIGQSHLVQPDS